MTAQGVKVTQEDAEEAETVKAPLGLRILVTVLGVAIVGMLLLIIVKVVKGDHRKDETVPVAVETTHVAPFKNMSVTRPEGTELISAQPGSAGVLLHFRGNDKDILVLVRADGSQQQIIVD